MRILYWIDVALVLGFTAFVLSLWQWNVRYFIGIGMAVVGFVLWMVARVQLGKSFSVRAQAKALVTKGLCSKFRHPIYLFGELTIAGLFIAWGELLIGCVYFAVTVPVQISRIRNEERVLEEVFREEYLRYKAGTWF